MIRIYGIKNCDTVRKARRWLEAQGLDYQFHDFRADGLSAAQVENWLAQLDWTVLLNKRGTTWRQLSDAEKAAVGADSVAALLAEHPTLIKRPVLEHADVLEVGFKAERYQELLCD